MRSWIPRYDYEFEAESLAAGEQVKINHTDCTAGEDTRERLYVKRTEDGRRIIAYCHNCSLSGSYTVARTLGQGMSSTSGNSAGSAGDYPQSHRVRQGSQRIATPNDSGADIATWEPHARVWVQRYGITPREVKKYGILYSSRRDAVVLPVYRDGKLKGYQQRNFKPEAKAKYNTYTNEKPLYWDSTDYEALQSSKRCIIVEDMLSGIVCARYHPTIALLGAFIHDAILAKIATRFKEFVIFMDDDNRQIKLAQAQIQARLEQFGANVRIISGVGKDPKECSNYELARLINY